MPLMHLQHGRRYCLGYCSDMRTEVAGNISAHPSLYPDMPAKLTQVQLRRHAGGKALRWPWLPVAHVLIRPRSTRRYRRLRRRYIGGM